MTRTNYVLAAALIVSLAGNAFLYREWAKRILQSCRTLTRACVAFVALSLGTATCAAAQEHWLPQKSVADSIELLLSRAEPFGFSGQVLFAEDGKVLLERAYGYADRSLQEPMKVATPVGIGSVSKHIVAAAVLALEAEGLLSREDLLGAWLDDVPTGLAGVTLESLLSHSSGIGGSDVVRDFEPLERPAFEKRLKNVRHFPERFGKWRYSNAGYALLALVAEKASGQTIEEVLRTRIFEPAGMEHTGLLHALPSARVAKPYVAWREQGNPAEWRRNWRMYHSVVSTAGDLYRLHRALDEGRVLSAASSAALFEPRVKVDDNAFYAYGFFVRTSEAGPQVIEHGGDWIRGYNAAVFLFDEDRGRRLFITSNARDRHGLSLRQSVQGNLDRLIRGEEAGEFPPEASFLDSERREALAGVYRSGDSKLRLVDDGALLWLAAEGQEAVDLMYGHKPEAAARAHAALTEVANLLNMELAGEDGFAWSLGEEGAPHLEGYRKDWTALDKRLGGITDARVVGATSSARESEVTARVEGPDGIRFVLMFWRENDEGGRVTGMVVRETWDPASYPVAFPVALKPDGGLVAYDLIRETEVQLEVSVNNSILKLNTADRSLIARR